MYIFQKSVNSDNRHTAAKLIYKHYHLLFGMSSLALQFQSIKQITFVEVKYPTHYRPPTGHDLMTDLEQRISQFENMTAADPDNEMAHFSLGNAYLQAGRHAEAAERFKKVIEINPDMSKAYQLGGLAMIECGWADEAVVTMEKGFQIAASRGDLMVRNTIEEQLKSIGKEAPKLTNETIDAAERLRESGAFVCTRTSRPGSKLESPPFKGPVGEWIMEHISAETWNDWIGQGTKVINELRLDFSRDEDQDVYDRHMKEFLGIDEELEAKLTKSD